MAEQALINKISLINRLRCDYEVLDSNLTKLQAKFANGKLRLAKLKTIFSKLKLILNETRPLGKNIDLEVNNEYNRNVTTMMILVHPNDFHVEPTDVLAFDRAGLAIQNVKIEIRELGDRLTIEGLTAEAEERYVQEKRAQLMEELKEYSTLSSQFCDNIQSLLVRNPAHHE